MFSSSFAQPVVELKFEREQDQEYLEWLFDATYRLHTFMVDTFKDGRMVGLTDLKKEFRRLAGVLPDQWLKIPDYLIDQILIAALGELSLRHTSGKDVVVMKPDCRFFTLFRTEQLEDSIQSGQVRLPGTDDWVPFEPVIDISNWRSLTFKQEGEKILLWVTGGKVMTDDKAPKKPYKRVTIVGGEDPSLLRIKTPEGVLEEVLDVPTRGDHETRLQQLTQDLSKHPVGSGKAEHLQKHMGALERRVERIKERFIRELAEGIAENTHVVIMETSNGITEGFQKNLLDALAQLREEQPGKNVVIAIASKQDQ